MLLSSPSRSFPDAGHTARPTKKPCSKGRTRLKVGLTPRAPVDAQSLHPGFSQRRQRPTAKIAKIGEVNPMTTTTTNPQSATHNPKSANPDWDTIRADFPLLQRTVQGKPIIYLDSSATSQKPQTVLDAMDDYYRTC